MLLGVALFGDLLDETIGEGHRLRQSNYARVYSMMPPGYKKANFTHAVWRMLKAREIEKVVKNGRPYLRITGEGKHKLVRNFSLLKMSRKSWAKSWCLVVFDIEEKDRYLRSKVRRKLEELGFGMLQKSVYISPYDFSDDLVDYFAGKEVMGKVFVLTCRHRLMGDPKELAAFVWSLEKLNQRYEKIFQALLELKKSSDFKISEKLKAIFVDTVAVDPFLPRELLPDDWAGHKVFKLLNL